MTHLRLIPCVLLLAASVCLAAQPNAEAILDLSAQPFHPAEFTRDNQKVAAGTVEPVDGKFGKAVRFSFVEGASGGFMTARVRPTPQWDKSAGFSFWVKGDGSNHYGGIELIDRDNFSLRYGYCFPINSNEWQKIVVPWRDVIPELAGPLINPDGGYAPSGLGNLWFGKWFYWRDYPAESFAVDQLVLEPKIELDPAPQPPPGAPLSRLKEKLAHHQPITIVTMGDSLTDEHHWSNRQIVWHRLLAAALKSKYGSEVKIVNPAIGGTTLSQNMILMPRWANEAPAPDLVTVFFGGNDWEANVRGPRFAEYLALAVDRIRRQTHGAADVLLMTTEPTHDKWNTMEELAQAVRDVAKQKKTGLADVAAAFHKLPDPDEAVKQEYLAWDKTHLGPRGHEAVKNVVLQAIEAPAEENLPVLDVWPDKAPGEKGQIGEEKSEKKGAVTLVTNVTKPTLTLYRAPRDKDTGAAVVICPGGGYSVLAWDLEGTEVAQWLNSIGVTGIILKYRVPQRPDTPRYLPPLQDAQRAISLVRSKAGEWGLDPHRIGMLGFSAGGNLTAVASTNYDKRAYDPSDDIDKLDCRPDFAVLVYPAWLNQEGTEKLAAEVRVDAHTPQMFIAHATDDPISVESSVSMYLALHRAAVPVEMHLYAVGGHGFGLRPTDKPCSSWPQRCEQWMRKQGLLKKSEAAP